MARDERKRSGPWYREGLRFACTRCGNCCTGEPGTVRVTEHEISALARFLSVAEEELRKAHTYELEDGSTSLRERANGDCVYWHRERGCTVYPARPRQCRTWPFWRAVIASPERWAEAARGCPGMDAGPLHEAEEIERTAADDGTSGAPRP